MKTIKIELVPIGEFVRIPNGKKVYTRRPYDRENKKYELADYYDISNFKYIKKGTLVEINFDF
jgi:hypothetical protein